MVRFVGCWESVRASRESRRPGPRPAAPYRLRSMVGVDQWVTLTLNDPILAQLDRRSPNLRACGTQLPRIVGKGQLRSLCLEFRSLFGRTNPRKRL